MEINIQIQEILTLNNNKVKGQINGAVIKMEFTPFKKNNSIERIAIKWEISMNINKNEYANHSSKTVFNCINLPLDSNILTDVRLELLSELAQISQAHSRVLFVNLNNSENIPLFHWRQHLLEDIRIAVQSLFN